MNYKEMKEIDLLSFSSKAEAKEEVAKIMDSEMNDILQYINYLRFKQFNSSDFVLMDKIAKFLFFEEFAVIERKNTQHDFGSEEELVFESEVIVIDENQIIIDDIKYICVAQFMDNFEEILIVRNSDGYKKFGTIFKDEEPSRKYVYELENESDLYYSELEKAEIGVKANILSTILSETSSLKTFIKKEIDVELYSYLLAIKTSKGIQSNVLGGAFVILKEETLLDSTKSYQEQEQEKIDEIELKIAEEAKKQAEADLAEAQAEAQEAEAEADFYQAEADLVDLENEDEISLDEVNELLNKIQNLKKEKDDEDPVSEPENKESLEQDLEDAINIEDYVRAEEIKEKLKQM